KSRRDTDCYRSAGEERCSGDVCGSDQAAGWQDDPVVRRATPPRREEYNAMSKNLTTIGGMFLFLLSCFATPSAYSQTRGCQLPPNFPCPDARIMEFKTDRVSIKPGQSVVLTWAAENPGPMRLMPGIGPVTARGSVRITPAVTT